jgi:hypothetical protein
VHTLAPERHDDDEPADLHHPQPPIALLINTSTRRFASTVTFAVFLAVLVAALLGPSQTLAQTHKIACSHARAKRRTHVCTQLSRKGKTRHASRHPGKHSLAQGPSETVPALTAASCEDGSAPARESNGSFSCADGSEPECENGATPARSGNGKSLLCPVIGEDESESEAECEEGLAAVCAQGTLPGSDEQACEVSSSADSSFICEQS